MSYDFLRAFGPLVKGLAVAFGGSLDGINAMSLNPYSSDTE
ncbi:hypothetical protein [Rhodococcus sp. NPDC060176]